MHRQGQGASALQIRRQGVARHRAASLCRRPVHRPRQGATRQSLRRRHIRDRDAGDRDANRREPCPHRRRPRLSRPQRPARPQVQGLYIQPEPRHRDQRVAPPFRHRTRSSATRRRSTAWAETTSPEPTATTPTPSSPPPATTSAACSNGWLSCCPQSRDLTWHQPSLLCCPRLRRLGYRPFIVLRLAAPARADRSTAATVTPRSQTGDLGGRRVERDPRGFGSFTLISEGHRKVWARLRVLDRLRIDPKRMLRLMWENGLLSPHRHLPLSDAAHDGRITTAAPNLSGAPTPPKSFRQPRRRHGP